MNRRPRLAVAVLTVLSVLILAPSALQAAPSGAAQGLYLSAQACASDGSVSATLNWTPSGQGAQSVQLAVDPGFASASTGGPFAADVNAVSFVGMRAGASYYARVNTATAAGTVASDTLGFVAGCGAAPPPSAGGPAFYVSQAPGGTGLAGKAVIALTFDDGPGPFTPQVLAVLQAYHVPATFFETGSNVASYPQYSRMVAAAGYAIGNHTWNHPILSNLGQADIGNQIDWAQAEIASVTGQTPVCLRPPYDLWNSTVLSEVSRHGLATVSYSIDSSDWKSPGTQTIVDRVVSAAFPGAIVGLHDGGADSQTVAALPQIITTLQARGYTFVSICSGSASTGGAATAFTLAGQSCLPNGLVRANFAWTPSGWGNQWSDLSTLNNNFSAGWYNDGPLPGNQNTITWDNLLPATTYYARINTWTVTGWRPGDTFSFTTAQCGG